MSDTESLGKNRVSISYRAARAAQGFNLLEKRLVSGCLSKLDSRRELKNPTRQQRTFRITAKEYAQTYGVSQKTAYRDLRKAARNLRGRYIRYLVQTPRGVMERETNWVDTATYMHSEGYVEIVFNEGMAEHLYFLSRRFISYRLMHVGSLRSLYSWRLYELLLSRSDHDRSKRCYLTMSLQRFRHVLEVPESYKYLNIRQRILDPICRDLRDKVGWEIDFQPNKKGRQVESITLSWVIGTGNELTPDENLTPIDEDEGDIYVETCASSAVGTNEQNLDLPLEVLDED